MRDKLSTAIFVSKGGGSKVFKILHPPIPKPGPGQLQIKMLAAGVAFADIMIREGIYPLQEDIGWPRTPGYDVIGEIQAVGANVSDQFQIGQRVACLTVHGSYARHRLLQADQCVQVPEQVDSAEAVALVLNYLTAWQMLQRISRARAGDWVVIHAGGGGVGTALLELAALSGIKTIAFASPGKHQIVKDRGGIPLDYRSEQIEARVAEITGGKGVATVFDAIGGKEVSRGLSMLKQGGCVVSYGVLSLLSNGRPSLANFLKNLFYNFHCSPLKLVTDSKSLCTYNVDIWRQQFPEFYRQDLSALLTLLAEGSLKPLISERIPLEEAARAQQLLGSGTSSGKLVLI